MVKGHLEIRDISNVYKAMQFPSQKSEWFYCVDGKSIRCVNFAVWLRQGKVEQKTSIPLGKIKSKMQAISIFHSHR